MAQVAYCAQLLVAELAGDILENAPTQQTQIG